MAQSTGERASERIKHYGTFGLRRVAQQLLSVRHERPRVPAFVEIKLERLRRDEDRIAEALGRPVEGQRMLVIGPGQLLREARFFAVKNQVVCLDLDVIPKGIDPVAYAKMLRTNGPARVLKTVGRKLIGNDRFEMAEWKRQLGIPYLPDPECVVGDVCDGAPEEGTWDSIASWSTFQHIPDIDLALRRCADGLRPGGVLYIGIHLWTSNTGHHDIRAFSGEEHLLPLWAHLRKGHEHEVESSAFLNRVRLGQWREAMERNCPGFTEYQQRHGEEEYRAKMTPQLREELADYDDEELYTVDLFFRWKKPA